MNINWSNHAHHTLPRLSLALTALPLNNDRNVAATQRCDQELMPRVDFSVIGSDNAVMAPAHSASAPVPGHPGPGRYDVPNSHDYR